MPLLTNKFSVPKLSKRKPKSINTDKDLVDEDDLSTNIPDQIKFSPAGTGNTMIFEDGQWKLECGQGALVKNYGIKQVTNQSGGDGELVEKLKHKNKKLQEDNKLLKIKYELLLDMISETKAQNRIHEKEIKQLKSVLDKVHD